MRVALIGSGYVGLVTGACLAEIGHQVVCVDRDAGRIEGLRRGSIPFYEPGLSELVAAMSAAGRLSFATDAGPVVRDSQVVFIAVGTPARPVDGHADLRSLYAVASEAARAMSGYTVIATKSTAPVGTGDEIERLIRDARPDADFSVVSNPEFLREGAALADFRRPDRIVIGTNDKRSHDLMNALYAPMGAAGAPLLFMRRRAAELTKYAANAFLAMKVTFINEIADLAEAADVEIADVERALGRDPRIGSLFLRPGPGFGGSCFPKDTLALVRTAQNYGVSLRLVEATATVNEKRKRAMARKVIAACGGSVRKRRIGVLGLTFKPGTDDVRDSPAIAIIGELLDAGAIVTAHDPMGMENARAVLPDVAFKSDPYEVAAGAHAIVAITDWEDFRSLDLPRLRKSMRASVLVDLRNMFEPATATRSGFAYASLDRRFSPPREPAAIAAE